ncbi:MAG: prepilin-type N-terminal cleavage/methylation domain-containing protein [Candidatus Falkowbacteria bacterium]|nr:prepilin-type N-terminal cleavage/methylation domain-containing protein [Candidatus Falkowbacteria bacterium]
MKKNNQGFTLIELLVVIGIIAILSTLSVVYFETARMSARDARRISDVKQIQVALKMYYNDTGIYPTVITAGSSISVGGTNYILRVPANPVPRNDGTCVDQEYQYTQLEGGQRYSLSFCLGDKTDDLDAGNHSATHNGILNCPTGYVAVPGSSTFQTNDFCVMKWEAKCATSTEQTIGLSDVLTGNSSYDNSSTPCNEGNSRIPVSVSSGNPIGNISQADAITYCQTIGGHLLTNPEWMTIARNLEATSSNWSNGVVGDTSVNLGNFDGAQAMDGTSVYGSGGSSFDYLRTNSLSNGEVIWDFSGNIDEWLDKTCTSAEYVDLGGLDEWTNPGISTAAHDASGPLDPLFNSTYGIGNYFGCISDGNVFLRGGSADNSSYKGGLYSLYLAYNNSVTSPLAGFRCVK